VEYLIYSLRNIFVLTPGVRNRIFHEEYFVLTPGVRNRKFLKEYFVLTEIENSLRNILF